jgi:predicted DNA-binding protein with PD1-like motif
MVMTFRYDVKTTQKETEMQLGEDAGNIPANDPFLARLATGSDLLEAIKDEFLSRSIRKAGFYLIGALSHAVLGFYDQQKREYVSKDYPGEWEIVSCSGNISEKDGDLFVHAHAVLGGADFSCVAGHVMAGNIIFAAEMYGVKAPGVVPVRVFDEPTGLALWSSF